MNFFQLHRGQPAKAPEAPPLEPPPLPKEETPEPANTVIHIDDAQYCLLTRALRPDVPPVLKDLPADVPGSNASVIVGGASQPTPATPRTAAPEQPPGTPIV